MSWGCWCGGNSGSPGTVTAVVPLRYPSMLSACCLDSYVHTALILRWLRPSPRLQGNALHSDNMMSMPADEQALPVTSDHALLLFTHG